MASEDWKEIAQKLVEVCKKTGNNKCSHDCKFMLKYGICSLWTTFLVLNGDIPDVHDIKIGD